MNPTIQQILKLFSQLSDDERLHVLDEIEAEYGLIGYERSSSPLQSPKNTGDKIHIRLNRGAIENEYIQLGKHLDFFPDDVFGEDNSAPKTLKLYIYGYATPVETDITRTKKRFRTRQFKELFKDCKPDGFIVIERLSDYEYKVYPLM